MTTERIDVLAVMDAAPSVTVKGVTVLHNTAPWRVATNRHSNFDGTSWGWIDGAPGNVCWDNSRAFNRSAAEEMVATHAVWLEEQKSLSIRLIEARERYATARAKHDEAQSVYERAQAALIKAEEAIAALARVGAP